MCMFVYSCTCKDELRDRSVICTGAAGALGGGPGGGDGGGGPV
jgi:hypothetical protein